MLSSSDALDSSNVKRNSLDALDFSIFSRRLNPSRLSAEEEVEEEYVGGGGRRGVVGGGGGVGGGGRGVGVLKIIGNSSASARMFSTSTFFQLN